jgi:hypothetical protein
MYAVLALASAAVAAPWAFEMMQSRLVEDLLNQVETVDMVKVPIPSRLLTHASRLTLAHRIPAVMPDTDRTAATLLRVVDKDPKAASTAIFWAAVYGKSTCVAILLKTHKQDLTVPHLHAAMYHAASKGKDRILNDLLWVVPAPPTEVLKVLRSAVIAEESTFVTSVTTVSATLQKTDWWRVHFHAK